MQWSVCSGGGLGRGEDARDAAQQIDARLGRCVAACASGLLCYFVALDMMVTHPPAAAFCSTERRRRASRADSGTARALCLTTQCCGVMVCLKSERLVVWAGQLATVLTSTLLNTVTAD